MNSLIIDIGPVPPLTVPPTRKLRVVRKTDGLALFGDEKILEDCFRIGRS